jgi:hypothetical protein
LKEAEDETLRFSRSVAATAAAALPLTPAIADPSDFGQCQKKSNPEGCLCIVYGVCL